MIRRRKRRKNIFKPNRAYINEAIDVYLKSGGRINKIIVKEGDYSDFVAIKEQVAHDFLIEGCQ